MSSAHSPGFSRAMAGRATVFQIDQREAIIFIDQVNEVRPAFQT